MAEKVQFADGETAIWYRCPGCDDHLHGWHSVPIDGSRGWKWNGSKDSPTITPSVKTWMRYGDEPSDRICHHFVRDGKIEYCGDSTHSLAGKTIEMVDINA